MSWVAVAVAGGALVGAGASIYGANKQISANSRAQQANQDTQDRQNNASWTNWLMTKGIAPTTPVVAGEMPTAGNYTAVNSRLPLWANVNMAPVGSSPAASGGSARIPFLVKKGGT